MDKQQPLPAAAVAALQAGNKIEAIKIVRAAQGIDLKDAKGAVDAYIRQHPALAASQAETKQVALSWSSVIVAITVIMWYFLFRQ